MMQDVEDARCLKGARLIFSLWSGYLEYEKSNPFLEWLDRHGIPLDQCHTAGHARLMELLKLREAFAKAPVVPIRARHRERFEELFGRVVRHQEGEWWEVGAPASS
jgi:ribonuclease J